MYFLIKSTSAFSLENSDWCVSIRTGDGMGVFSGKIISDGGDVSIIKACSASCLKRYVRGTDGEID